MSQHVVTGASAGLGEACAVSLAARGEDVIAVARRSAPLESLARRFDNIEPVVADVCAANGRAAVVSAAAGSATATLIHGAATAIDLEPWSDIQADELTRHFAVHVASPIALTAELHKSGGLRRCVIFDSYSAQTPRVGWAGYSIVKSAAQMAFRAASDELEDIAIGRVYPGAVATPLLARVLDAPRTIEATAFYHELKRLNRVSQPSEIADSLISLLLDSVPSPFESQDVWHFGHSASLD